MRYRDRMCWLCKCGQPQIEAGFKIGRQYYYSGDEGVFCVIQSSSDHSIFILEKKSEYGVSKNFKVCQSVHKFSISTVIVWVAMNTNIRGPQRMNPIDCWSLDLSFNDLYSCEMSQWPSQCGGRTFVLHVEFKIVDSWSILFVTFVEVITEEELSLGFWSPFTMIHL